MQIGLLADEICHLTKLPKVKNAGREGGYTPAAGREPEPAFVFFPFFLV